MAKYKVLTSSHPTYQKVREVEALMDKLNLCISTTPSGQIVIEDREKDLYVEYRDIEQGPSSYDSTVEFPYFAETKLILKEKTPS